MLSNYIKGLPILRHNNVLNNTSAGQCSEKKRKKYFAIKAKVTLAMFLCQHFIVLKTMTKQLRSYTTKKIVSSLKILSRILPLGIALACCRHATYTNESFFFFYFYVRKPSMLSCYVQYSPGGFSLARPPPRTISLSPPAIPLTCSLIFPSRNILIPPRIAADPRRILSLPVKFHRGFAEDFQ